MKKQTTSWIVLLLMVCMLAAGCGKTEPVQTEKESGILLPDQEDEEQRTEDTGNITPTSEIVSLEDGLSAVHYALADAMMVNVCGAGNRSVF